MYWKIGRISLVTVLVVLAGIWIWSNVSSEPNEANASLRILSGSENQSLEPIIQAYAEQQNVHIEMVYEGSVDIMRELNLGADSTFDAVWPANRMWITLGDTTGVVQHSASVYRTPVVLGVKRSVAEQLGWIDGEVRVDDVLAAAEAGQLDFLMANAGQSDAGASAYLGFLYAFADHPDMLFGEHLGLETVQDQITRILSEVNRTSGSAAFLTDLLVAEYGQYDAMFNYESAVIEANSRLIAAGQEPLQVIYLVDGTTIADAPLAYIDAGDPEKESSFRALQDYLLSDDVQAQLLALGRRAGISINPDPSRIDLAVFNPDWGIDTQRMLTPIKIPEADVVREALNLYQSSFRRPALTVILLDYSGSMATNNGEEQMKAGMHMLLDQTVASLYLLQAAPDDVTVIIPFSDKVLGEWTVVGDDPDQLLALAQKIEVQTATGGTAIYDAVHRGLEVINERGIGNASASIVLMTDGESNEGRGFDAMAASIQQHGWTMVPIYGIRFGSASREQLDRLAEYSSGAVFDGREDLAGAFRVVKGYT